MKVSVGRGRKVLTAGPRFADVRDKEEDSDQQKKPLEGLGFKDYLAISLAALETFLLPLLAIVAVLAVLVLIFTLGL